MARSRSRPSPSTSRRRALEGDGRARDLDRPTAARSPACRSSSAARRIEQTQHDVAGGASAIGSGRGDRRAPDRVRLVPRDGAARRHGAAWASAPAFGVIALASQVIDMPNFSTELAAMIGLGRRDRLLAVHRHPLPSRAYDGDDGAAPLIVPAMGTAGRAVLFAGIHGHHRAAGDVPARGELPLRPRGRVGDRRAVHDARGAHGAARAPVAHRPADRSRARRAVATPLAGESGPGSGRAGRASSAATRGPRRSPGWRSCSSSRYPRCRCGWP